MEQNIHLPVGCDPSDPISSPMWAELPFDVLTLIIAQTTDTNTLDSWCNATKESHLLHEIAMTARWRSVIIDDRDLLPAPGDDTETFHEIEDRLWRHNLGQDWKPVGQMVKALLRTIGDEPGHCPANYVRDLVLDFRLLKYWEEDMQSYEEYIDPDWEEHLEEEPEPPSYTVWNLMPTLESLKYTLSQLEGHFRNLRSVSSHGDTHQIILDFVARQDAVKICSLELRSLGAYGHFQVPYEDLHLRRWPLRAWLFQFEGLSTLRQLRSLEVHHFSNKEIDGLLALLPRLVELQCLILACEAGEHNYDSSGPGGCAIKGMFDQIFENRAVSSSNSSPIAERSGSLPPNLKSLSLIDTYSSRSKWTPASVTQPPLFDVHLTHLCLDLSNVDCIPMLIDYFPEDTLESSSIPGCSFSIHASSPGFHAYADYTVAKHKETLDKIILVRAWNTDLQWIEGFLEGWQGLYAIQELVLGTLHSNWYEDFDSQWRKRIPNPTLSHYLCGFEWDNHGPTGRWGSDLERIRIDHLDLSHLEVSVLSEPSYSRLKILMLQPAPRGKCNNSLPGCEAVDETMCMELAKRIIVQGAVSLRVIVITSHWYWAPKDRVGSAHDSALWTWAEAKEDPIQNELMSSSLGKADIDFLEHSTVPFWHERHERDLLEWPRRQKVGGRGAQPYKPNNIMLSQWNYLTVFRLHDE